MSIGGIDPGLKGGIAVIEAKGVMSFCKMPLFPNGKLNEDALVVWIKTMDKVIVERQQSFPVMGKVPNFSLGYQYGVIIGIAKALKKEVVSVRPQVWKRSLLVGFDTKEKESSILYINKRFPKIDLTPTPRSVKQSDGIADALCLALYGVDMMVFGGVL